MMNTGSQARWLPTRQIAMTLSPTLEEQIQQSMDYRIYWSCHQQHDESLNTGWRFLPYWVLLYTHQGVTHCFEQGEHGEQQITATARTLLLIPAGTRHRLLSTAPSICDGLHINFRLFQSIDLLSLFTVPQLLHLTEVHPLYDVMHRMTYRLNQNSPQTSHATDAPALNLQLLAQRKASSYELLASLLAVSTARPERTKPLQSIGRIQHALSYIEANLDQPLRVDALAELCAMSRNRFTLLFKTILGLSPRQYLAQKRLTRAMSLLADSDESIASIADALSFCDQFHFSKWFKKATGESPRSYRDKIRLGLFR